VAERPPLLARLLGMGREFAPRDRAVYLLTYAWTFLQIAVFAVGTVWSLTGEVGDGTWLVYWEVFVAVQVVLSAVVILWFTIGGARDIGKMVRALSTSARDERDDGRVREEGAP